MFNVVRHQFFLFKLAIVFLTRLPVSIKREVNDATLNLATGYFGLVGFFIATLNASVLFLSMLVLPIHIAVLLSMAFGLMLTGAFHEDGLADTADGFGGGWLPEQKLTIMKDSRLGTYGASALCISLLIKFQALLLLAEHNTYYVIFSLLLAHTLSRVLAVSIIPSLKYVQLEGETKTKPVATSLSSSSVAPLLLSLVLVIYLVMQFLDINLTQWLGLSVIIWLVRFFFIKFTDKQIGGYTGDVLGAAQQVFELVIYIFMLTLIGSC